MRIWSTCGRKVDSESGSHGSGRAGFSHGVRSCDGHRFPLFCGKTGGFTILEVGLGGTGDSTNVVEKPADKRHHVHFI